MLAIQHTSFHQTSLAIYHFGEWVANDVEYILNQKTITIVLSTTMYSFTRLVVSTL